MSDRTITTSDTQAEVVAEQTAADVQQAAAQAEQAEQQAREDAQTTLKAMVKAYRKGESAYRAGLLEAGRLADVYVHQRLALRDKRAAAVQAIEGQLAAWSSSTVDVGRLIACYHAFRLLADEPGVKADAVPYGHFRDAWAQLVQRQQKDTADECWVLLPGLEDRCRETFAGAAKDAQGRDAAVDACKGLLREFLALEAEKAKAEKQRAEQEAAARAEEEAKARQEREEAGRRMQDAEQAARDTANADTSAALERSRAELLAKQRVEAEAAARAEQAAREQARREQEAKDAADRERKALDRQRKARDRAERKAPVKAPEQGEPKEPATVTGNLLRSAAMGTPKDLADCLVQQARLNSDPLAVLWELGSTLAADAASLDALLDGVQSALSQGKARQLFGMALAALRGRPGVSPAEMVASQANAANGTPAAASAA